MSGVEITDSSLSCFVGRTILEAEERRPRTRTALTRPTRRSCRRMIRTRMEAEAECPQNDLSQEIRGRRKCMRGEGDGGGDVAKVRWGQRSLVHVCPAVSILVIVWLSRLHARTNGGREGESAQGKADFASVGRRPRKEKPKRRGRKGGKSADSSKALFQWRRKESELSEGGCSGLYSTTSSLLRSLVFCSSAVSHSNPRSTAKYKEGKRSAVC